VKPVIEIMASIPSVALGFVAALALSPIVETWIAAVVLAFVAAPVSLIAMAYLWQLLPSRLAVRFEGIPKFLIIVLTLVGSLYATVWLGPAFERLFFAGNFIQWTNGSVGRAAPFLFLLLTPVSAFIVSSLASRYYGRRFQSYLRGKRMPYGALIDLARWLAVAGASAGAAFCLAMGLEAIGFDPRGDFVGSYVQRNTLIVGFAMGFAVIPIIYTLAEDALNSVPEHLRSASLGCGATPWQTAKWIILPTALSGVFSAVMIGMGRAVGETMIVVMSAGNTPIIDWNIFNGLRALSANIAVELPEAPKDGSLYRVLFLTGLVLFGITFVINTAAELVRMRFRKRTGQL
jgi:phosphate transport system permease protein